MVPEILKKNGGFEAANPAHWPMKFLPGFHPADLEWLDDGSETGTPPTAAGILKRFYRLRGQP